MAADFDALVIGGGPGGATAALLLARAGWNVAVLEKAEFPRRKVCGEFLSATNFPLFRDLGILDAFAHDAGPEVYQVGLYAGESVLQAEMPRTECGTSGWGRALAREHLDTLLLASAAKAGARVFQPWSAISLARADEMQICTAVEKETRREHVLRARVVVAAHGSWGAGGLCTEPQRRAPRRSDMFGFKAHFMNAALPQHLMPMMVFPGGYGGMVNCDGGRASLSCCIRRDVLDQVRAEVCGLSAGQAVVRHIQASCLGVRQVLHAAEQVGSWLSAGPIETGIRIRATGRVLVGTFLVGNAAGEAHPIIAEGISMAIQSAWLLCRRLAARADDLLGPRPAAATILREIGDDYSRVWLRNFAPRIHAAAVVAHWAMRPMAARAALPLLRALPSLLALGARLSGKAHLIETPRTLQKRGRSG